MNATVEIFGLKELQQKMKALPTKVAKKEVQKIIRQSTKPVISKARALAPKHNKPHRHYIGRKKFVIIPPGALAKSIGNITSRSTKVIAILVGPRAKGTFKYWGFIGHMVEYGTVYMRAQPYMRPAYESTKGEVKTTMEKSIAKYLQTVIDNESRS